MPQTETATSTDIQPTTEELRLAYRLGVRHRATDEFIVRLVSRGDVKFAIWGPGEEVHGTAAALALSKAVDVERFGMVPHYRSGCMCLTWSELNGYDTFTLDLMRQQFSKDTDPMSRGRQMVYHLVVPEIGILPIQSPVGMQLDKAAGYAMGFRTQEIDDGVALAVIGDGTTAEGDLHDAMNAASVWDLPLIVMITDNNVAISTYPEEGRGIRDFAAYAEAFGFRHFECDGRDFWNSFDVTYKAASYVRAEQRPALVHVRDLPRFNGHSSAADVTFDLSQDDPLIRFGEALVGQGILDEDDILRRKEGTGRDFFAHHEPGRVMEREMEAVRSIINQVRNEPDPPPESITENVHPPFPDVDEERLDDADRGETAISYAGAIRAALDHALADHGGVVWGQDVARLGGVMTATQGLEERHPRRILDAPLNEPLIVGTACGIGLHDDIVAFPEIQFGDYSLNAFHWLVHMGNLYWSTNGRAVFSVVVRMPTDPFGGGAIYHSMSLEGYFSSIPGLVVVMPATSYDVYGMLLTAAEYGGPVVVLEPKWLYRLALGPAFPDEPTDEEGIAALKKRVMRGEVPEIDPSVRVPFGKAATRRRGGDLTIVAWGRALWTSMDAAEDLAAEGVEAEVIDLRTIVPADLEAVLESVGRTGRLVVAAEDRPYAGFVRAVQGAAVEEFPGLPTRAIGQKNIPGIAQSPVLEKATVLSKADVAQAAREVLEIEVGAPRRAAPAAAAAAGDGAAAPAAEPEVAPVPAAEGRDWLWIPPRYFKG